MQSYSFISKQNDTFFANIGISVCFVHFLLISRLFITPRKTGKPTTIGIGLPHSKPFSKKQYIRTALSLTQFNNIVVKVISNPHYSPETSAKTTIVNFAVKEQVGGGRCLD